MTRIVLVFGAIGLSAALPAPAHAGELFGGIYKHAVDTPLSLQSNREGGVDFQLGYRGGGIVPGTGLQPYVFGALNSSGDTSYAAAGLSWKFGRKLYVRPGLGIAVHTGSAAKFNRPDRIAFGSRLLLEPEIGLGYQVSDRVSVEASWIHMSHAQLLGHQNPGIDNVGVRLNFGL